MDKTTSPTSKKSFFKDVRKSFSRSRFQDKQSGKIDYIRTKFQLASEEQSTNDDKHNRKIYENKMNLYRQIKSMIDESEIMIDFDITNEPQPPPTPDNHTLWLKYQQDMTPQPSWKVVNATAYLISKGYQPGVHFNYHQTIDFCMKIATQNNEPDILEYNPLVYQQQQQKQTEIKEDKPKYNEHRYSIPTAPPEYLFNNYVQPTKATQATQERSSLYNIDLSVES